ncbi:2OG-Fe(II) oxygenase [Sphingomonas sp. HITSZ_GF]|uniref:prolyl hydroxylase family protein n=1 Tax=Sphingomonas sp. HITSZ_GF TaxID=3037247 RepID=UPI00240E35B3|nr:2OG-Fe(II) oxygenase [Sphingomonas sp. HITSZ_GF]MDG2535103.1 2OG-Fe(II) oxygenase [Sphingomonas sp. HITSZ_GF]
MKLFGRQGANKPDAAPPPPPPAAPAPTPAVTAAQPASQAPPASLPGSDNAWLAEIGATVRTALDANPAAIRIQTPLLEIYAVKNFIRPEECIELIAMIDRDVKPSLSLRKEGTPTRRTSETCFLSADVPLVAEIERRIATLLNQPLDHSETVQGQRYTPGQQFKVHNDYFAAGQSYSDVVAAEGGQRTWTAMAYLDRPEGGGQTHFPKIPIAVPPTPGVLLVWNNLDRDGHPNRNSHHEGMMVEGGVKHVLTKWFRERPWHSSAASDALRR